jgi:hypothetical protein
MSMSMLWVMCCGLLSLIPQHPQAGDQNLPLVANTLDFGDQPLLLYFFEGEDGNSSPSQDAIKLAVENGFRVRRLGYRDSPALARHFRVSQLPALRLVRNNKIYSQLDGPFTFGQIKDLFSSFRQKRLGSAIAARWNHRQGTNRPAEFADKAESLPTPPVYIPTSSPAVPETGDDRSGLLSTSQTWPSGAMTPLDRHGRFPVANTPTPAEQRSFEATVKLRVVDQTGTSYGTGTIIHSVGRDALVLTCGHLFRESRGQGRIVADVQILGNTSTVSGQVVSYDSGPHDIALLTIHTPSPVSPVPLAGISASFSTNEPVFTIGCDRGNAPTIRRSHYKRRGIYDGVEKHDVHGRPVDGRSGGGLFNAAGEIIGVCNAAACQTDEGIYSGLATIYHQITISHLAHLFSSPPSDPTLVIRETGLKKSDSRWYSISPRRTHPSPTTTENSTTENSITENSITSEQGPLASSSQQTRPKAPVPENVFIQATRKAQPSPVILGSQNEPRVSSNPRIKAIPDRLFIH